MKKWCFFLTLILLFGLSSCNGAEDDVYFWGQVEEVQWNEDGSLSALILDVGDGERKGVFLDGETTVNSAVEDILTGEEFRTEAPLGTGVSIRLRPDTERRTLIARDGTEFSSTGTAMVLMVEEARSPDSLTLSDGTEVEIWADARGDRGYRLSDGTELLRESPPETDFSGYYVAGDTSLQDLPPALLTGIERYYRERGPLYDIQKEVERAYGAYAQAPEEFQKYMAEQDVSWSAVAPGVYYFCTTLSLSVEPRIMTESQVTDAFDRETGAHIPIEELFSVSRVEAAKTIVAGTQAGPGDVRAMEENFQWTYLCFEENRLDVWYPAGTLPGEEYRSGWGVDYSDLGDILHPWAVPETTSEMG